MTRFFLAAYFACMALGSACAANLFRSAARRLWRHGERADAAGYYAMVALFGAIAIASVGVAVFVAVRP